MPYYQFAGNGWLNQVEFEQPRGSSSGPATPTAHRRLQTTPTSTRNTLPPSFSSARTNFGESLSPEIDSSPATRMGGKKRTGGKSGGNSAREYDEEGYDRDDHGYPLDHSTERGYVDRHDRAETMAPPTAKRYKPSIPSRGPYPGGNSGAQPLYPADTRKSNTMPGPVSNAMAPGPSKPPVMEGASRRSQGGGSRSSMRKVDTPTSGQEPSRILGRSHSSVSPSPPMDDVEEAGSRPLKHRGYQQVSELEVVGHNIIPSPLPSRKPRCNWDPIQHTKTDSRCCFFTTDVDLFESKYHPVKGTETRDCSIEIVLLNDGYYGPMIITREGHRAGKFLSKKDIGLCNAFDGSTHSLHCAVRWTEETDLLSAGKLFYGIVSWKARNCPTFPSLSGTVGGHQGIAVGGGGPAQVAEDGRVIKREPMSSINSYGAGHGPHGHGRM